MNTKNVKRVVQSETSILLIGLLFEGSLLFTSYTTAYVVHLGKLLSSKINNNNWQEEERYSKNRNNINNNRRNVS